MYQSAKVFPKFIGSSGCIYPKGLFFFCKVFEKDTPLFWIFSAPLY